MMNSNGLVSLSIRHDVIYQRNKKNVLRGRVQPFISPLIIYLKCLLYGIYRVKSSQEFR